MPLEQNSQPGWFEIVTDNSNTRRYTWIHYNCPCGCGSVGQLPLVKMGSPHNDHTWEWDGNEAKPTLSPSIRRLIDCKFHGWLRAGVWSSAGDGAPLSPNVYAAP